MPQYEDVYEPPMLDSTGQAIASAIQGLNPTVPSFISDAFSVERNYSKGDICIYDNKVYEFTSAKSAGAWDSTKVTQTTIGAVCTSLNNSLTNLDYSESSYSIGGAPLKIGIQGKCIVADIAGGTTVTPVSQQWTDISDYTGAKRFSFITICLLNAQTLTLRISSTNKLQYYYSGGASAIYLQGSGASRATN